MSLPATRAPSRQSRSSWRQNPAAPRPYPALTHKQSVLQETECRIPDIPMHSHRRIPHPYVPPSSRHSAYILRCPGLPLWSKRSFSYPYDPPEISQQIISVLQINAGVCAKTERIAITAKITAAATAAIIIFLFIAHLCFLRIKGFTKHISLMQDTLREPLY